MKKKPTLPNFTGVKNNHLCAVKIITGTSIKAWARKVWTLKGSLVFSIIKDI